MMSRRTGDVQTHRVGATNSWDQGKGTVFGALCGLVQSHYCLVAFLWVDDAGGGRFSDETGKI